MNSEVGTLRPEVLGKLGNTESNNCEKDLSHTGEIDDKLFKKKKKFTPKILYYTYFICIVYHTCIFNIFFF